MPTPAPPRSHVWWLAAAWFFSLFALGSLLLARPKFFTLDAYHAFAAWLVAAAALPAGRCADQPQSKTRWRLLAVAWCAVSAAIWLGIAYSRNQRGAFHIGLMIGLALVILCKAWFQMPSLGIHAANTLILLLIGLPIADLFVRPAYRLDLLPESRKRLYSYEAARKDPAAFAQWWDYFVTQWHKVESDICVHDPEGVLPFRVRPGSQSTLFQSRISMNSLGFRGKEVLKEKGDAYRIVALGESTTFGFTLNADDRPWPELLEEMIRRRLTPKGPVEVINAGLPSHTLAHNLRRLKRDILPLSPDMIISYHGANGFHLLDQAIPPPYGKPPPAYTQRPLKLLGDSEYRAKLLLYTMRQDREHDKTRAPTSSIPAMETPYARAYRELVEIARTNHIRLVLANYSMAINAQSGVDAVAFYRSRAPTAFRSIRANETHSEIVLQTAAQHPEVCFVDTHPHLDGEYNKFIDLIHFTQEGRQQMAETMFAGIKAALEEDLSKRERHFSILRQRELRLAR
jgi:lysophospholipase L1-like esterase